MSAHQRLLDERKRAADVIRRFELGDSGRLAQAVESGDLSAWGAMVEIHVLPAVATIDALCHLRVVEAWAEGREEDRVLAEREACAKIADAQKNKDAADASASMHPPDWMTGAGAVAAAKLIADAIRARK